VLVIMLSEMGSIVLAGPMFASLRARYPQARLHLLQLKKNREVAEMLQLSDADCLHTLDDSSGWRLLSDIVRVCWRMRRLPVGAVVDCELFSRISSLLAYLSGAPRRAGFTPHTMEGLYRGSYINCEIPYNPYRHISLQFLSLVDALEPSATHPSSPPPTPLNKRSELRELPIHTALNVPFSADELQAYKGQLLQDHPQLQGRQVVLMYPGGGILPERAWPQTHYAELARGLCDAGHAVGWIGLREDAALAHTLQQTTDRPWCVDLTGYTRTIRELLLLFHSCQLLITNDGGPGHFASLTPIAVQVFFGPETSTLYGPLPNLRGTRPVVWSSGLACSPCLSAYNHRNTFCDGDNQCLKQIPARGVLAQALQTLAQG
jgi:ADP-heptose:LPS heptosyltransferase